MELASHRTYDGFHEADNKPLSDEEKLCWLRLIRSDNIGPITFYELLNQFGSAQNALKELPNLAKTNHNKIKIITERDALAEIKYAEKLKASLVALGEEEYPRLLQKLEVPPPLLYIKGDTSLLNHPILSIVGSRNGSAAGKQMTKILAAELGSLGYVIASGLARGIDTTAHLSALDTGTIGVVAGGINIQYPPENSKLQQEISERGLLIAENPPGFKPRGKDFPRRNRIISGLSHAVIVVEAALKSGSLVTARYALEQNREVFAMPGNPLDPRAAGTNRLIKQGANILTSSEDITEILAPILRNTDFFFQPEIPQTFKPQTYSIKKTPILDTDRQKILLALGPTPVDIDEIIRCTGLSVSKVNTILLELDLAGKLERHGRQLVSLISSSQQGSLL